MTKKNYRRQAALLLDILPAVAKENCFAMHGGTAINLFVRDMPRVSVDIDLTYLPIEDRSTSLTNIATALERIKTDIEKRMPDIEVLHKPNVGKLLFNGKASNIKLEVNLVARGTLLPPQTMPLCKKAQDEFDVFSEMRIAPIGQLYGGKICAALDRQHPRDLFDIKNLMDNEGFTEEIKTGFLLCLLSGDRPMHEIIAPNLLDQHLALENQFAGMSSEPFSYEDYETIRNRLISTIHHGLTKQDKEFLLRVKNVTPDWSIYDFEQFPAVQWKLRNLKKLKETNAAKHSEQYKLLRSRFEV